MGALTLTCALACIVVLAIYAEGASVPRKISIHEHLQNVFDFPCKEPQRRAIRLSESGHRLSTGLYVPPVTVLHRCDKQAGCCNSEGYACGPAATQEVERSFTVITVTGKKIEKFSFTNHTLCSCQKVTPPK